MSYRADRLAQEVKVQISLILARELRDPRVGLVTVTDARMSPDLRYARVFVSVFGDGDERQKTLAALNQASGFVRRLLGARLRLRHSPELTFCFDQSVEQGARMEEILAEVKKEMPDLGATEGDEQVVKDAAEPSNQSQ